MSCWLDPMMWPTCAAIAGANAAAAVFSIPGGIAHSFGDTAASAVAWLWQQVSDATTIDLASGGIRNDLVITAAIAAVITVALFAIQVIGSAVRGNLSGLGRCVRGLLIAFVGATFAIAVTEVTLAAVDALADGVVQAAVGQNIAQVGAELVTASSLNVLGWAGMLLMSLVLLLAVAVIWCALMIRKMLIIIAAVFAPIAFSGATSDITKGWVRRWVEFTVALVFSKLILVVIFMIGLSMVNGAGSTSGVTNQVTNLAIGTLTLLLAGFAPWMAIKMVHFAGDALHHVQAQAGAATSGAGAVISAPSKAASVYAGARRAVTGSTAPRPSAHTGATRLEKFVGASTLKPGAAGAVRSLPSAASSKPSGTVPEPAGARFAGVGAGSPGVGSGAGNGAGDVATRRPTGGWTSLDAPPAGESRSGEEAAGEFRLRASSAPAAAPGLPNRAGPPATPAKSADPPIDRRPEA